MDAVANWVRSRGGSLGLRTALGEGTTVGLQLPLSVAIIPALLVGAGEERYAIPVSFVAETTRVRGDGDEAADLAGRPLPVRRLLPLDAAPGGRDRWRPGLVLEVRGRREILLVDRLLGQEEIVVGPLDAPRGTARWVAGATILSDGRPALILDPGAMVQET